MYPSCDFKLSRWLSCSLFRVSIFFNYGKKPFFSYQKRKFSNFHRIIYLPISEPGTLSSGYGYRSRQKICSSKIPRNLRLFRSFRLWSSRAFVAFHIIFSRYGGANFGRIFCSLRNYSENSNSTGAPKNFNFVVGIQNPETAIVSANTAAVNSRPIHWDTLGYSTANVFSEKWNFSWWVQTIVNTAKHWFPLQKKKAKTKFGIHILSLWPLFQYQDRWRTGS